MARKRKTGPRSKQLAKSTSETSDGSDLNAMQRRFAEEYVVDLNITKAAERAGYSKKSAAQQGHRLLNHAKVAAYVRHLQAERSKRTGIDGDKVMGEVFNHAWADLGEVIDVDEATGQVSIKPLSTIAPEHRRLISEIKQTVSYAGDPRRMTGGDDDDEGAGFITNVTTTIKTSAKAPFFRMLMDHLGLDAPKKLDIDVNTSLVAKLKEVRSQVSPEAFAELLAAIRPR